MRVIHGRPELTFVFVGLLSVTAAAQWPSYPTRGIPRLPDGKPNLSAPVRRTADGKPDLSGMWHVEGPGRVNGLTWNVAQDLAPEEVQPWARALYRDRLLNLGKDSPMARCLPRGLVPSNAFPAVFSRIVQTPELIVIIYGGDGASDALRTIFTDGRGLPKDPNPAWLGYSIGRWESDTLVVTTTGFNDRGWLDFYGHPQTESLRITERFRRRDLGHMEFEMIIDDPAVFTRPLSLRMDKVLVPDAELPESICESEKDAGHLVGGSGLRLSGADLSKYAGTYEFAPGRDVTLTPADGHLVYQDGTNGAKRALVPQSETVFVFRDGGDAVEFSKSAAGTFNEFFVRGRTGNNQKAVRKGARQ
jgi:hypothetical protein